MEGIDKPQEATEIPEETILEATLPHPCMDPQAWASFDNDTEYANAWDEPDDNSAMTESRAMVNFITWAVGTANAKMLAAMTEKLDEQTAAFTTQLTSQHASFTKIQTTTNARIASLEAKLSAFQRNSQKPSAPGPTAKNQLQHQRGRHSTSPPPDPAPKNKNTGTTSKPTTSKPTTATPKDPADGFTTVIKDIPLTLSLKFSINALALPRNDLDPLSDPPILEYPSNPSPNVTSDALQYISNITVVATETAAERPCNAVSELSGQSSDINHGLKGKYAWLVPTYTENPDDACTGFNFVRQNHTIPGLRDMSEGAGGQFRHLIVKKELHIPVKVRRVGLARVVLGHDGIPSGFRAMIGDLNEGRGGSSLYFMWD